MTSEISVERQFRFHCSCGVTIVTGERKVNCTACGITLGVRRVRRHRQDSGSVAYYGRRTHPVRRVERHREQPNTSDVTPGITMSSTLSSWLKNALANRGEILQLGLDSETAIQSPGIASRLDAWLKSALASCGEVFKIHRVERPAQRTDTVQHTDTMQRVEAQELRHDIPDEPRGQPAINQSLRPLFEGVHVKVGLTRPDGSPHPHAGKTGRITKFADAYADWLGLPSAMIKLDSGIEPRGFIWVSLQCLEALPEDPPTTDL
jgi:hypothetical protein